MHFNRLNAYVFMIVDVILQIAVLSISNEPSIGETLAEVKKANCWSLTSVAPDIMGELISLLDWVNVLGWLELGIVSSSSRSAPLSTTASRKRRRDSEE